MMTTLLQPDTCAKLTKAERCKGHRKAILSLSRVIECKNLCPSEILSNFSSEFQG